MVGNTPLSPRAELDRELLAQVEAAERPIAGGEAWIVVPEPGASLWTTTAAPEFRVIDQRGSATPTAPAERRPPALPVVIQPNAF